MRITASIATQPAPSTVYEERIEGPDLGLISAWWAGRELAKQNLHLAAAAILGELPVLPFKGGVERAVKSKTKVGAFHYIAMWQGLRGEDLCIDTLEKPRMICSKTRVPVTFTMDVATLFDSVTSTQGKRQ